MIDVPSGSTAGRLDGAGYRMVLSLARCAAGQPLDPQLIRTRDTLYYPETLRLLSAAVIQERYPAMFVKRSLLFTVAFVSAVSSVHSQSVDVRLPSHRLAAGPTQLVIPGLSKPLIIPPKAAAPGAFELGRHDCREPGHRSRLRLHPAALRPGC